MAKYSEEDFSAFFEGLSQGEAPEQHPNEETFRDYLVGTLDEETASAISAHLTTCESCSQKFASVKAEVDDLAGALAQYNADELRDLQRKDRLYRLAHGFISRFYPAELDFLSDIWDLLKDRTLQEISEYRSAEGQGLIGSLALGSQAQGIGEHSISAVQALATLLKEEGIDDITQVDNDDIIALMRQIAKDRDYEQEFTEYLLQYLVSES